RASGKLGAAGKDVELQDDSFMLKLPSSLSYSWSKQDGASSDSIHKFILTVPLGRMKSMNECGEGGGPQVITTKTQELKVGEKNYHIPISFQSSIQPGKISPLVFSLTAPRSS